MTELPRPWAGADTSPTGHRVEILPEGLKVLAFVLGRRLDSATRRQVAPAARTGDAQHGGTKGGSIMSKLTSAIVLGIGLAVIPAAVARAQLGGLGDAAKKGATDAVQKKVVDGVAEKAGVGASGTAAGAPGTATGAPGTVVGTAGVTPAAAASPAAASPAAAASPVPGASPAAAGTASPATAEGGTGKMLMDQAGKKVMDEAGKKMAPKLDY
jgi:hypothetical protein